MTIYEKNYQTRLNEMLDEIIHKFGYEHKITIRFAKYVEKYFNQANYQNREIMETIFKNFITLKGIH